MVFETGYDDDGEDYAGKTLEKVLREGNVEGSVVVARWFGGVLLGPVRFDHIRNCASEAVRSGTRKDEGEEEKDGGGKRMKAEDDGEKQKLIGVLEGRDLSIGVLRGLLAGKKVALEGGSSQPDDSSVLSSPSKGANYAQMDLAILKRLEEVRDKTIGWILGQIEEVEKALGDLGEGELLTGEIDPEESRVEESVPGEQKTGETVTSCTRQTIWKINGSRPIVHSE